MRTPTKKRPPMEMEPGEGKAHEMKESREEEVREGAESEEGEEYPKPSRKRSAKGAKRTKAPMDCEGCAGKTSGKCKACAGKAMKDGCGSYPMKKRSDALTAPEYLAACELGIQGRSRNYIRARLDTAQRLDLKCGKGAISQGEKCSKGAATKAQGPSPLIQAGQAVKGAARRVDAFGNTDLQQHALNEKKEKKWRKSVGYRDSATYAQGFKTDFAQLAI